MSTPDISWSMQPTLEWALQKADTPVRVKPKRPYTPYNLFYLLERELVVQDGPIDTNKPQEKAEHGVSGSKPEDQIPLPARYNGIVLPPNWNEPNCKEKRKHRKTHGKISFQDLTEMISKNWASIDEETKHYCQTVSEIGRKRYKEELNRYNASQKLIELKAEQAEMIAKRHKRQELFKTKPAVCSPPRLKTQESACNAVTPDRITYAHRPVVTPPHRRIEHNVSMFYPTNYGIPPPMPPPSNPHIALQRHHPHPQHHGHYPHQQQRAVHLGYPQATMTTSGNRNFVPYLCNDGTFSSEENSATQNNQHYQYDQHHQNNQQHYPHRQHRDNNHRFAEVSRARKENDYGTPSTTVDVQENQKTSHTSDVWEPFCDSMTHDDAMKICTLIGSDHNFQEDGEEKSGNDVQHSFTSMNRNENSLPHNGDEQSNDREQSFEHNSNNVQCDANIYDLLRDEILPLDGDENNSHMPW